MVMKHYTRVQGRGGGAVPLPARGEGRADRRRPRDQPGDAALLGPNRGRQKVGVRKAKPTAATAANDENLAAESAQLSQAKGSRRSPAIWSDSSHASR